jgi:hypothetical protein
MRRMRFLAWSLLSLIVAGCSSRAVDSASSSEAVTDCEASQVGGSHASQTIVKTANAFARMAADDRAMVESQCAQIAKELGASQANLDAAAGDIGAMCQLAISTLHAAISPTASVEIVSLDATCTVASTTPCLAGCVPANGACKDACNAYVQTTAACNWSIDVNGDPTLKAVLKAHLGPIAMAHERAKGLANVAGPLGADVSAAVDILAACIPVVVSETGHAAQDVTAVTEATGSLLGAVGQ